MEESGIDPQLNFSSGARRLLAAISHAMILKVKALSSCIEIHTFQCI